MGKLVLKNACQIVTKAGSGSAPLRGSDLGSLLVLENASVVIEGETIAWIGATSELPRLDLADRVLDVAGKTILPGWVDSHTHLVFAGSREAELEQRLSGWTYQQISEQGGGINSTVAHVRGSTPEQLARLARGRLQRLLEFGVTTVEVKSGYGLSLADELKCLEVIARLDREGPQELVPTFLGAHAVPPEYRDHREGYVELLIREMIPEVARRGLAEFCDVFCESGVFSLDESERILTTARDHGMRVKVHADELTPLGGAELAVRLGAVSADHLLCVTDRGVEALARSGTVAALLPGTAFYLGLPYAPARRLIESGVAITLATDCNPGTCPTENLPLVGAMACMQMKMSPAEVINALTHNAAAAVGRSDRIGSIEVGKQADVVIYNVPDYRHLLYHFGVNHVWRVLKRGRVVHAA